MSDAGIRADSADVAGSAPLLARCRLHVDGIVQGVGFRPFVHGLAARLGLHGFVANDAHGVVIEIEGSASAIERFGASLTEEPPPLARVTGVSREALPPRGERGFAILDSRAAGVRRALVSPDVSTCDDCLRELFDPADRRHRYPFLNCTNCGPRFTIVRDVPYDRTRTTMDGFAMCAACAAEYRDPTNRRFHAEPICCPACGPRLRLVDRDGRELAGDAIALAARALEAGAVLAVKGIGGYHLAAVAADESAVGRLRARKHREEKPFAVLVADVAVARTLAEIGDEEERSLTSRARPIVLLERRADAALAPSVAPATRRIGLLLPYAPLHHLLIAELGTPIVLTSGNLSDEPIAHDDGDARSRLAEIADLFLLHDRPIHVRADDSVVQVAGGVETPLRRSRGFAPEPLSLPLSAPRAVLACGGELKATFCLAEGSRAFLSHHLGDLENFATLSAYRSGIDHFRRLFDIRPEIVAHDLHPAYLSTQYAREQEGVERLGVQHHHAHVAACLADNGETGPALGVAFDGLGYGGDGTLWGGEFLIADLAGFERFAHLATVAMPGGSAAIREPWRMGAAWLDATYGDALPELPLVARHAAEWRPLLSGVRARVNAPLTSSVGRLFDAVAALLDLRDSVTYEGQAAILLEQITDPDEDGAYAARLDCETPRRIVAADLIRAVVEDRARGIPAARIAARFHNGIARIVAAVAGLVRAERGLATVALTGGVFQNRLLLERTLAALRRDGFRVLVHHRVPANDGGLAFGQAAVAAAHLQRRGGAHS